MANAGSIMECIMGIVKRFVHVIAQIIYVLIVIYALVCAPMIFGYKPLVVLSGSMEPSFSTGSVVYYTKVSTSDLKAGDIITFEGNSGIIISHRIEKVNSKTFVTKGDANNTVDPQEVPFDKVLGRDANFYIPFVGYFIKFVNDNLLLVGIPVVIILLLEFFLSNKDFDKDIKERSMMING